MATKTLILRPISAEVTIADPNNKASMSVTPSDTSTDAYHTLLSEEVADNDSTYIAIAGGYYIDVKFNALPQDIKINNIKIIVMARTPSGNTGTMTASYNFYKNVGGELQAIESSNINTDVSYGDISAEYTQFICESSLFTQELISNQALDYVFRIIANTASNVQVSITQIYAEVAYEIYVTPIYFKNSGSWTTFSCRLYQKINSNWVMVEDNSLIENERFKMNSLITDGGG